MAKKILITLEIEDQEKSAITITKRELKILDEITNYLNASRQKAEIKEKTLSEQLLSWLASDIIIALTEHNKILNL